MRKKIIHSPKGSRQKWKISAAPHICMYIYPIAYLCSMYSSTSPQLHCALELMANSFLLTVIRSFGVGGLGFRRLTHSYTVLWLSALWHYFAFWFNFEIYFSSSLIIPSSKKDCRTNIKRNMTLRPTKRQRERRQRKRQQEHPHWYRDITPEFIKEATYVYATQLAN